MMMESGMGSIEDRIEQLRAIRKRLGWSEETCAHHLGVSYSTLSRWERGESLPKSRLVLDAIDRFVARHRTETGERG
jgi:transcriptional regulator with XRE-family HTH domain